MMTTQDLVNMLRSIQFQAISAQVHGQWLVDKQTVDPDEFMNKLNSGTGSVLQWDSRGPENRKPPQMVNMGNVDNNLLLIANDLINGMKDQVHLEGTDTPDRFKHGYRQNSRSPTIRDEAHGRGGFCKRLNNPK